MKNQTFRDAFLSENFPKMDIDTSMDLCYISNKSLHGLFCKNVHIFVKGRPCNKCALLQGFGRYGQRTPQCYVADAILYPRLQTLPPVRALRRFLFHHFEKLVLDGFLGVRIAEAPKYQHGVPSLRHGDAIRGTVRAAYVDFTAFTFQFPLLSRRSP